MGFYRQTILPFLLDKVTGTAELTEHRKQLLATARGRVLEIGFGTGLNAPHYPSTVEQVVAIDPNYSKDKRAQKRIAEAPVPIELRVAAGEELPVETSSFDCVVTSLVLCSVDDTERTLSEIRRVLKPDGRYLFFEHGLSDNPKLHKWQNRMNGFQMRMFGGCHLNRPIRSLLEQGGFHFETVRSFHLEGGPHFATYTTVGSAIAG